MHHLAASNGGITLPGRPMGRRVADSLPTRHRLLRVSETTVRLAVPEIAHARTLRSWLELNGAEGGEGSRRGVPSGVWVGWLGGEDQVDLRTSNRVDKPAHIRQIIGLPEWAACRTEGGRSGVGQRGRINSHSEA